jgi:anti-anti-sigma regulatory factor
MIQLSVRDFGTLVVLTLRGSLSEIHAGELRANLLRGLGYAGRLIVNCEQVASLDMNCLKLLCTAYRVSHTLKKDFVLAGNRIDLFRKAAGPAERASCGMAGRSCEEGCLWTDVTIGRYCESDASQSMPAQDSAAA